MTPAIQLNGTLDPHVYPRDITDPKDPGDWFPIDLNSFRFSAGEIQVRVGDIPEGTKTVDILANVFTDEDAIKLSMTLNALKWENVNRQEPFEVDLTIPYMPYGRQDRPCAKGEAFSLEVFLSLVLSGNCEIRTLTTWDVHNHKNTESVVRSISFAVKNERGGAREFRNIEAHELVLSLDRLTAEGTGKFSNEMVIIAPDKGAEDRAKKVCDALWCDDIVYATKKRDPNTGQILETVVPDLDYSGADILIVDDICDGGRTFIELAKVLRSNGRNPASVSLYVTHGIFSKGFEPFGDLIDYFYVANLLPNNNFYDKLPDNLVYLQKQ